MILFDGITAKFPVSGTQHSANMRYYFLWAMVQRMAGEGCEAAQREECLD